MNPQQYIADLEVEYFISILNNNIRRDKKYGTTKEYIYTSAYGKVEAFFVERGFKVEALDNCDQYTIIQLSW